MKQGKRQLKELGMEHEFADWLKDVHTRPRGFEVGDKVRVIGGNYGITSIGSEGHVVHLKNLELYGDVEVNFHKITGISAIRRVWGIDKDYLKII